MSDYAVSYLEWLKLDATETWDAAHHRWEVRSRGSLLLTLDGSLSPAMRADAVQHWWAKRFRAARAPLVVA